MKLQFVTVTNGQVLAISYVQRTENVLLYVPFNDCIMYLLAADIFSSIQFSSVAQSCPTLWSFGPHGLQHARPPCPSPTPRVYSNSCPLSQ